MGLRTKIRNFLYKSKFNKKISNLEFSGKNILITGANSGIGLELTKKLLELKNNVISTYRENSDMLRKINNKNLKIIKCDQRNLNEFENLKSELENTEIEVIINCAAVFGPPDQNIEDLNFEKFKEILMVNSLSILKIIQTIFKKDNKLELVVNISSDAGSISLNKDGNFYIYRSSKSTLNSITKNLSVDLNRRNGAIVLAIDPGNVKSNMNPGGIIDTEKCAEMIIDLISRKTKNLNGKFVNLLEHEIGW